MRRFFYYAGGWKARGGILEILKIALPLVLASAGHALNLFTDRMMLQWYHSDAMAAALPSGLTSFALSCFFVGTVGYANSFVAQYYGAKMPERVGVSVWQAIHMAVIGAVCMLPFCFIAPEIFAFFGHEAKIQPLEVEYFRILTFGGAIPLLMIAFSTFWGGQGKTSMIMAVNLMVTGLNIPLNYLLIFGHDFGFAAVPEFGITGAAYGTVLSGIAGCAVFAFFFFRKENDRRFRTRGPIFDGDLFKRLFRFGAPNGLQLFLDLASFNCFIVILGKINATVLAAAAVAFSINSLAFTPMIGVGQTVSILVGQGVGASDIPYAERSVRGARTLIACYMFIMTIFFIFYPDPIFRMFRLAPDDPITQLTRIMLYFIAAYLMFDGCSILYGSAIKGAGDTKFAMWIGASMAWAAYAFPAMLCYFIFTRESVVARLGGELSQKCNLWTLWTICVLYIMGLGILYFLRYRTGKWKSMKVIETEQNDHPRGAIPKEPGVDTFLP